MRRLAFWLRAFGLMATMIATFAGWARGDEVVSLTAPTSCPATNGNGGDWCQGNGGPAFNLSSFKTENISTTGSAAFF